MSDSNALQDLFDGMGARLQRGRRSTGMTLGGFIAALESLPPGRWMEGFGQLASYRGYYCDLAVEPRGASRTVAEVLANARSAMGRQFDGYKGGDFLMGEWTPLWVASYGNCGPRLIGLSDTDPITAITRDQND